MTRIGFLLAALLIPFLATASAAERVARKPNIVFILVDDMPYAGPSVTGNTLLATPHIDRIAREGMFFSRAYSEPVCGPSRATLMTGQFSGRHGRTDNAPGVHPYARMRESLLPPPEGKPGHEIDDAVTSARLPDPVQPGGFSLVQALKAAGYRTAITGKWHLPANTITPKAARRYGFDVCTDAPDRSRPYRDTQHFTDDAVQFIRDSRDQPFFLYIPLVAVHGGHVVPTEDRMRWKQKLAGKDAGMDPDMLASLEYVDLSVGRILAVLDELNLADDTLVVFTSDNGGVGKANVNVANKPFRLGKGTLYEGGIRVPLFVRWPGHIAAKTRCDVPVHFADFPPTLCAVAGAAIPSDWPLDGVSLLPLFAGGTLQDRTLYASYPHYLAEFATTPVRAVIQGRYKLVWHPYDHIEIDGGRITPTSLRYVPEPLIELFDLEADPSERENLADRHPEKVTELKGLMEAWMKESGAKDVTPNPEYDPSRPLFNSRDEWLKQTRKNKS
ncbi:MAG: hypothetical protein EBR28_04565 [Planctomycetia bacterium]|nr:hypothetical protein [Planctomycetia bacterium]